MRRLIAMTMLPAMVAACGNDGTEPEPLPAAVGVWRGSEATGEVYLSISRQQLDVFGDRAVCYSQIAYPVLSLTDSHLVIKVEGEQRPYSIIATDQQLTLTHPQIGSATYTRSAIDPEALTDCVPLAGEYELGEYNGAALPALLQETQSHKVTLSFGRLTVRAGGSFTETFRVQSQFEGEEPVEDVIVTNGTFYSDGSSIRFRQNEGGYSYDGTIEGDALVVTTGSDAYLWWAR